MPLLRKLDAYVFRETLGPFLLGLLVFTFILLMDALYDIAKVVVNAGVSLWTVLELVALNLPNIMVLTIPMAFLFGLLIAVGRLSADSELIAMRASGVSLFWLYRPLLLFSAILTLVTGWLIVDLMPRASVRFLEMQAEIQAEGMVQDLSPRVFHELNDKIVYFTGETPDGKWTGMFLSDALPMIENEVLTADQGELRMNAEGDAELVLRNSRHEKVDLNRPDKLEQVVERVRRFPLRDERGSGAISVSKSLRAMTLPELREAVADEAGGAYRQRLARVEIHKRFAIPAACLVFGLFGLPLGFSNRRGGRSSGFVLSVAVILAFYVMLSNGEENAAQGNISPWLAMWGPNILFAVAGAFLLWRKNRDQSLMLSGLDRWIREHGWARLNAHARLRRQKKERRRASAAGNGNGNGNEPTGRHRRMSTNDERSGGNPRLREATDFLIRFPRFTVRFPNVFDRYIMKLFVRTLVTVVAAVLAVYVIADFTELVDEVMENDVSSSVVFAYYRYFSLQIFYQMAPIIVLLTTLTTFAVLSYSNEITAAKAVGMSLYRLAVPALFLSICLAIFSVVLQTYILPVTNTKVAEYEDVIKGRTASRSFRRPDRNWLHAEHGDQNFVYNYSQYDPRRQYVQRLQIFRFDEQHRPTGRLWASQALFRDGQWWVKDGWARSYQNDRLSEFTQIEKAVPIDIPERPDFFDSQVKSPDRMSLGEFRQYVSDLRAAGESVPNLEVELHNKIAMPIVCVVMALVALPFAFRLGRKGALYGIGISLAVGIAFYGIIAFFTTLGEAGALPPAVAVWSPNVLFSTFSLYLFLGVRT